VVSALDHLNALLQRATPPPGAKESDATGVGTAVASEAKSTMSEANAAPSAGRYVHAAGGLAP
jgi:hypothetical protein